MNSKKRIFWLRVFYPSIILIISFIILVFLYSYFSLIYKTLITKGPSDYAKFAYALFAANAVVTSCLFAFARSPIFIQRFNEKAQKLIYVSGTMFLYSTIIGFLVSGWIYMITDKSFSGGITLISKTFEDKFILINLCVGIGVIIAFSIAGLIYFIKWTKKAVELQTSELESKI